MEFGRRCGSSANFLSKPEVPGKTEGPGSGGSGEGPGAEMSRLDRKFRWSGFCQEQRLWDRGFGRKNLGKKPKSEGEKEEIGGKEGWGG